MNFNFVSRPVPPPALHINSFSVYQLALPRSLPDYQDFQRAPARSTRSLPKTSSSSSAGTRSTRTGTWQPRGWGRRSACGTAEEWRISASAGTARPPCTPAAGGRRRASREGPAARPPPARPVPVPGPVPAAASSGAAAILAARLPAGPRAERPNPRHGAAKGRLDPRS